MVCRARRPARRAHRAIAGCRRRRRRREAAHDRRAERGRHRGRDRAHRPRGRHHLQLPLLAAQQRAAPGDPGRHDRAGHLGRLLVDARHQARRRLLPPLAPREGATPAACSSTRRATTSTSSTGGSAATPRRVFASGGLRFYGAENAAARGIRDRPARGTHDGGATPFELDLRDDERLKALYLDAEQHDGYLRDRDVFSEGITIEDNLALVVDYASRRDAQLLPQRPRALGGIPRRGQRHRGPRRTRRRRTRRRPRRRGTAPGARPERGRRRRPPDRSAPRASASSCSGTGRRRIEVPIDERRRRTRRRRRAAARRRVRGPRRRPARPPGRLARWRPLDRRRDRRQPLARDRPAGATSPISASASSQTRGAVSRIVVTGGAGRLGRSLVAGLVDAGHELVSLDRDVSDAPELAASRRSRWI